VKDIQQQLQTMADRLRQVVKQTQGRILGGITQFRRSCLACLSRTRRSSAKARPETQRVWQISPDPRSRKSDCHSLRCICRASERSPSLGGRGRRTSKEPGRVPSWRRPIRVLFAGPGKAAQARGVKYVSVPNRSTRSAERRKLEKRRWFQERSALAHWFGGPDQRSETETRSGSLSLSRLGRLPTLGGLGSDGRLISFRSVAVGFENNVRIDSGK